MERGYRERGRRSRGWVGWALTGLIPSLFTYSCRNLPCGLYFFPSNEPTHMSCRSQTSFQGRPEVVCLGPIRTDAGVCDDGGVETGGMRLVVAIHGCSGI